MVFLTTTQHRERQEPGKLRGAGGPLEWAIYMCESKVEVNMSLSPRKEYAHSSNVTSKEIL